MGESRIKALLVSDDARVLYELERIVKGLDNAAAFVRTPTPSAAVGVALEHWDLDLVIVDHDGADAGWTECLRWIVTADPHRPVALLSAAPSRWDLEAAARSGASGLLIKGSSISAQRDLLRELLPDRARGSRSGAAFALESGLAA